VGGTTRELQLSFLDRVIRQQPVAGPKKPRKQNKEERQKVEEGRKYCRGTGEKKK